MDWRKRLKWEPKIGDRIIITGCVEGTLDGLPWAIGDTLYITSIGTSGEAWCHKNYGVKRADDYNPLTQVVFAGEFERAPE